MLDYLWLPLGFAIFGVLVRLLEHFCRRDDAGTPFSQSHNLDEAEIMILSQHF